MTAVRPTLGFRGHQPDCLCGRCAARRRKFGATPGQPVDKACDTCHEVLLPLAFPRLGEGRGPTCRNCLPHGPAFGGVS